MYTHFVFILLFCYSFLFFSCSDISEENLKLRLNEIENMKEYPKDISNSIILKYKTEEILMNESFVLKLQKNERKMFNQSLERFEDIELGFWNNYKYIILRIIYAFDNDKWNNYWRLKSDKYFNSLSIQQGAQNLIEDYQKDVVTLRKQITIEEKDIYHKVNVYDYKMSQREVIMDSISEHAWISFIIEVGVDIICWAIVSFIVLIVGVLLDFMIPYVGVWVTILGLVISTITSIVNDNRLVSSMENQYEQLDKTDYNNLLKLLNENTTLYYDQFEK